MEWVALVARQLEVGNQNERIDEIVSLFAFLLMIVSLL
jgi:hypothetical protein